MSDGVAPYSTHVFTCYATLLMNRYCRYFLHKKKGLYLLPKDVNNGHVSGNPNDEDSDEKDG